MRGLDEARQFYEDFGREMIRTRFPAFEGRIAVGLAGHGSQCFGFDDALSRDHDFERGFCLWLTDEDDAAISVALSRAYRELTGSSSSARSAMAEESLGVRRISDFYRRYTGSSGAPESWQQWLLAAVLGAGRGHERRGLARRSRRVFRCAPNAA